MNKEKIKSAIIVFIVLAVINGLAYLAYLALEKQKYSPNCWEEKIEGINIKTGNKAYYSDNFECKYFIPK